MAEGGDKCKTCVHFVRFESDYTRFERRRKGEAVYQGVCDRKDEELSFTHSSWGCSKHELDTMKG